MTAIPEGAAGLLHYIISAPPASEGPPWTHAIIPLDPDDPWTPSDPYALRVDLPRWRRALSRLRLPWVHRADSELEQLRKDLWQLGEESKSLRELLQEVELERDRLRVHVEQLLKEQRDSDSED